MGSILRSGYILRVEPTNLPAGQMWPVKEESNDSSGFGLSNSKNGLPFTDKEKKKKNSKVIKVSWKSKKKIILRKRE